MTQNKKIGIGALILMGGAVFSMHFGASCMLWPVTWGQQSGSSVIIAYIAILLSALLLPMLGYVALARGDGTLFQIATRACPKFGKVLCGVTVLVMGPLYIIPRMSAASWDAICQLGGWHPDSILPIFLFNCAYYAVTYWFCASKSAIVDKISKFLFPILILIVIGVIGRGLLDPITTEWIPKTYPQSPLAYGFLQGYQTGDLPAALMFGMVIVASIKSSGITEGSQVNKNIIKVGLIGMGMLACTHLGHMIVGACTGDTMLDLSLSALYTQVVLSLWGTTGGIFFNIALVFAALTTAIGLSGSTAEYFEESLKGKYSYKKIILATMVISTIVASIGLTTIVAYIGPLLNACYPAMIVMVLYYVLMPNANDPRKLNACRWGIIAAAICGTIDVLASYNTMFGINNQAFIKFYDVLPFSNNMLTWIPVAVICFIIGYFAYRKKSGEDGQDLQSA